MKETDFKCYVASRALNENIRLLVDLIEANNECSQFHWPVNSNRPEHLVRTQRLNGFKHYC